jgi:hypothetical protein
MGVGICVLLAADDLFIGAPFSLVQE